MAAKFVEGNADKLASPSASTQPFLHGVLGPGCSVAAAPSWRCVARPSRARCTVKPLGEAHIVWDSALHCSRQTRTSGPPSSTSTPNAQRCVQGGSARGRTARRGRRRRAAEGGRARCRGGRAAQEDGPPRSMCPTPRRTGRRGGRAVEEDGPSRRTGRQGGRAL